MKKTNVEQWTREDYDLAAREYEHSLTLEEIVESTRHAMQREISVASLGLLRGLVPGFYICNELLVQYPVNGGVAQLVPDNMVIRSDYPLDDMGSYNLPFEQGQVFWVLEYVSTNSKKKDYGENFRRYGKELKVPYYLLFDLDECGLHLHRHDRDEYREVSANEHGRLSIPEIEVEVALIGGWVRFWFRGELLPLPAEMFDRMSRLESENEQLKEENEAERRRAESAERTAEQLKEKNEAERRRAESAERAAEQEKQRADLLATELQRLRALLGEANSGGPTSVT